MGMTAILDVAKVEAVSLKDANAWIISEHESEKARIREALDNMEAKRDKLQAMWQYLTTLCYLRR